MSNYANNILLFCILQYIDCLLFILKKKALKESSLEDNFEVLVRNEEQ